MTDLTITKREELQIKMVLAAEEGRCLIKMGHKGPMLSIVHGQHWWCLDEPDKSVPLIEDLIPQLETAGSRARKCAEEGKKILQRWEGLKLGKRKPTDAELKFLARHVNVKNGPSGLQVSVTSKKPEIVKRAAEIAEKILGTPQPVQRR